MAKVYASLIKKGLMALEDIKDEAMREEVRKILEA